MSTPDGTTKGSQKLENTSFINRVKELNQNYLKKFLDGVKTTITNISTETIGWSAVCLLHAASLPSLYAIHQGISDQMLPIEMILLVWAALILIFLKAVIQKDILNIVTIGLGFAAQSTFMALIFFK
jgi:hypothetical protein